MVLIVVDRRAKRTPFRGRVAKAVGEAAARSNAGAEVMNTYCFYAVMAGTRWLSNDARAQIERQVEYDYVHMRPPFRRP